MFQTITLGFLGGVIAGNALPHFVRGITKRRYPCALGNGPVPNLVAGWFGLVLGGWLLIAAHLDRHPVPAAAGVSVGVLLIGLFHAGPGAFGRPEPDGASGAGGTAGAAGSHQLVP
ncbi:hypothetical protein GCM10009839_09670 [Catenulispora yoronensis]|uniref:Uncharacterized protein n=1 Tax=Catenulispora yoronensis TaxID=450799 RepID=A0ABN2TQ50_9ACTN